MTRKMISPEYAEMNRQLHADHPEYGVDASGDAPGVVSFARKTNAKSILDFGCGKGALKPAIAKIAPDLTVFEYDPAIPGKDQMPTAQVDLIAAMDVMEHIEADCLDSVLEEMCDLKPILVLMKIALTPAMKTLPDGRNAHILLRAPDWWRDQLQRYFTTRNFQVLGENRYVLFAGFPIAKP